jgi:DNA-binding FadR family transcriptional regulator
MELQGIQTTPAHVTVANSIRRWIALGMLAPGARLPSERELSERLGVGRMTVRQAIRLLASEGLVLTQRGRTGGTFILDDDERPLSGAEVTEQVLHDVCDNFDFRLGVEPVAARLAAERAEPMERWAIRGLAEGEAKGVRSFRLLDSRFHLAIAEASHNRWILEAVSQSRAEFFRWADVAWERVDWESVPARERDFGARHRPIAEVIQEGAASEAEERMTAHLVEGKKQFLDLIEDVRRAQSTRA